MAAETRTRKRDRPTFIEEARRKQIIQATIDTVAEIGLANASLAEIAKVADISKAVIPYYFGSKDELIEQTLDSLYTGSDSYIGDRVAAHQTALGKLRAWINAQLEYARDNRSRAIADWELMSSFDSPEAKRRFNSRTYDPIRQRMAELLRSGQESGELRAFPAETVASLVLGTLDGIILQWTWDEDAVDLDACCQQALNMIEPFLRRAGSQESSPSEAQPGPAGQRL